MVSLSDNLKVSNRNIMVTYAPSVPSNIIHGVVEAIIS